MTSDQFEAYRRFLVSPPMTTPAPAPVPPPQLDGAEFYAAYWGWLFHGRETWPMNEEIERIYRQMMKHKPKTCPHGKTLLTCGDCWFNGWRGE